MHPGSARLPKLRPLPLQHLLKGLPFHLRFRCATLAALLLAPARELLLLLLLLPPSPRALLKVPAGLLFTLPARLNSSNLCITWLNVMQY